MKITLQSNCILHPFAGYFRTIFLFLFYYSSPSFSQQFPCDGKLYFFGQNAGQNYLSYLDGYGTPGFVIVNICPLAPIAGQNTLGANPIDKYLYFTATNKLYRIDANCNTSVICTGIGPTDRGCFDHLGRYWIIDNSNNLLAYDINTCTQVKGPFLLSSTAGADIAFNMSDCHFYMANQNNIIKIDTNGTIVAIYSPGYNVARSFGGIAIGQDGNLYGIPNGIVPGELYKYNLSTLTPGGLINTFPGGAAQPCGCDMASFPCRDVQSFFTHSPDTCGVPHPVQFTNQSTGFVSSFIWDFGDSSVDSVNLNPLHSYTAAGTYTVNLIVSAYSSCPYIAPDTFSSVITVVDPPIASFISATVCVNSPPTQFTDLSSGTFGSWLWDFGDPASVADTSSQSSPAYTYTASGTYTVMLVVVDTFGCTGTITLPVTVNPKPAAVFSFSPTPNCFNNPTIFTDQSAGNPILWDWDFGDGNTSAQQNPSHTYSAPGTYTASLVVTTTSGCKDSASQIVHINPLPIPNFNAPPVCIGNPTSFSDLSNITSGNITGWSWNFGEPSSSSNISTVQNPSHTYAQAGSYTVVLTVTSDSGCQGTIMIPVQVMANPLAVFSVPNSCMNITSVFTDNSTGNPTTWSWNFGDGGISTQQNPSHTYLAAGTYTVTLIVSAAAGCKDTTTSVVIIYPVPVPLFTADTVCVGSPSSFTDQSFIANGNITSWSWNFGDGNMSGQQNPIHTYSGYGNYNVTLTVISNNGCATSNTIPVFVYPRPDAEFSYEPTDISLIDDILFIDLSSGGVVQWLWDFGDSVMDSIQFPSHIYENPGTYTVTLIVTSQFGCKDTMKYLLKAEQYTFYIPNSFSPNGDGVNDFFFGIGMGIAEYEFSIFDRWGNLIFFCQAHNEAPQTLPCRWDGMVSRGASSKPAQEDVYVYNIKLTNIFKKEFNFIGSVTVVR